MRTSFCTGLLLGAIRCFPKPSWCRRLWLLGIKTVVRTGLRFKLFPQADRSPIGYFYDHLTAGGLNERSYPFVRSMVIELSSVCNAKCSFCPYPLLEFPKKIMTDELFSRSLEVAIQLGIRKFDFTPYLGEPFVDPQFLKRIRQLRDRLPEAEIRFTTNGTFFTRSDCEAILTSGVNRINISFGAWGREDYQKLYNIDAWETVLGGIQKLLDTKRAIKADVKIALWYRTLNAKRVQTNPENRRFLESYKDMVDEVLHVDMFYDLPSISGLQPEDIQLSPQMDTSPLKRAPCANLSNVAVSSTGNVFMCFCAVTDAHKQAESWFHLGPLQAALDLDQKLAAKAQAWERGEIPVPCRTCPLYIPASKSASIQYETLKR